MVEHIASASAEEPAAVPEARESGEGGPVLRGLAIATGLALGRVRRKDTELVRSLDRRVPRGELDAELNRFHRALESSAGQLTDLRRRLEGRVGSDDVRVLDTHLALLKDSVFLSDVESRVLEEGMPLEAAIGRVVADFDRIYRLVENEILRQSAVDLRDVGIRVLRNLEREAREAEDASAEESPASAAGNDEYDEQVVLVARALSIVDMFDLKNQRVLAIACEEGGLTSHAAIFARSMGIPTLTGVEGLLEAAHDGQFVILDASEGVLRLDPPRELCDQYKEALRAESDGANERPDWARLPARTSDGHEVRARAICGSLPELEEALSLGLEPWLYRTELLFLVEREAPSLAALERHYASVLHAVGERPLCFRLLHHGRVAELAANSAGGAPRSLAPLGLCGTRMLLAHEWLLRRQLGALLRASAERGSLCIAVPAVVDCGELRRVREVLFEEKLELVRAGLAAPERVELAAVIETPAALWGLRELAKEASGLVLHLDALTQHLLAADRDDPAQAHVFEVPHPFVLRALREVFQTLSALDVELSLIGSMSVAEAYLPALLGTGFNDFMVPPARLRAFIEGVAATNRSVAEGLSRDAARASSPHETARSLASFRHGLVQP